jgi:FtsP/CotA-like multicopper oxidase with cupredoxin domain
MAMDINDIDYDAYLANDRTLDDPAGLPRRARTGGCRLRLINGATATAFWIDTGALEGELVAVDGNAVAPGRGPSLSRLRWDSASTSASASPSEDGAWPILALREGAASRRTGFVLATAGRPVLERSRLRAATRKASPPLDLALRGARLQREARRWSMARSATSVPIVLGGTMQGYAWTLNGRTWGEHQPLRVRQGDRVELIDAQPQHDGPPDAPARAPLPGGRDRRPTVRRREARHRLAAAE